MKKQLKKILSLVAVVVVFTVCFTFAAEAGVNWGTAVHISYAGQVVDSITYNGKTVNAVYAPRNQIANYDSDTTYCCAAFVKRFYSSVFGVGVYILFPVTHLWFPQAEEASIRFQLLRWVILQQARVTGLLSRRFRAIP